MEYIKTYSGKTEEAVISQIIEEKECSEEDIFLTLKEEKKGVLGLGSTLTYEAYTIEDVKEFIFNYLGNFFMESDIEVTIEIKTNQEKEFLVNIEAEKTAQIIGKNGNTINAINKVVRTACNRTFKNRFEILVDTGNYKEERYRKVTKLAINLAKKVTRTKVDVELDRLSSDERKTIHKKLENFNNIETVSIGEGSDRKLVIKYKRED